MEQNLARRLALLSNQRCVFPTSTCIRCTLFSSAVFHPPSRLCRSICSCRLLAKRNATTFYAGSLNQLPSLGTVVHRFRVFRPDAYAVRCWALLPGHAARGLLAGFLYVSARAMQRLRTVLLAHGSPIFVLKRIKSARISCEMRKALPACLLPCNP